MKKKILLAVVAIICLLSMVLAGCSNIKIENVDEDVIKVLQDAIANSEQYSTYYIREKTNTNPKDIASNTMVEYMLNVQSDKDLPEKEKIAGVDKTKINFSVKTTKGITESTDSFIIGNSLPKSIKPSDAKAEDYKLYVFETYKQSATAPVFTRDCKEITDPFAYVTPTKVNLSDYTMANALLPLKSLAKDDIVMSEKGNKKQGKVTTYVLTVKNEAHEYNKHGELKVMLYTDKGKTRVMSVTSTDEKYTLDVMYQGPKIDIPNYDGFKESDNKIDLVSNRSDGMIELYAKDTDGEYVFVRLINPVDVNNSSTDKKVNNSKITTVESAINWGYEYTEIVVEKYEITDEQGNKIDEISGRFFIKTSNIVKTQKDMTSLIPIAAAVVAVIALLIALMALFKIKKQNKELTAQIKAITGETDEENAETETAEGVDDVEDGNLAEVSDEAQVSEENTDKDAEEKTEE